MFLEFGEHRLDFSQILKVEDVLDQPTKQNELERQFPLQAELHSGHIEDLSSQFTWLYIGRDWRLVGESAGAAEYEPKADLQEGEENLKD